MKDLGDLYYFLGLQVVRSSSGIFLTSKKCVHKFQFQAVKIVNATSAAQTTLSLDDGACRFLPA